MNMKRVLVVLAVGVLTGGPIRAQVVNQAAAIPAVQPSTIPIPLGPTLDVIPHVSADGYTIQLNLIPTITEFLGYDPTEYKAVIAGLPGGESPDYPLPHFRIRQITTSAIIWDGQTVALGGLIAERVAKIKDKVPVLGDLPLVGRLFRSEASQQQKKNLIVFVTPTIIDPAGNRIHTEDNLPYDPNKVPPQVPFAPK